MIVHRTTSSLAWWLSGLALIALAWWGKPLVQSDQFENHFYGLFYYSILAGMALFWALPSEQRCYDGIFERRTMLFGLIPLYKVSAPVQAFSEIRLEQDPNLFRKDTIWLMVCGVKDDSEQVERFAFANWSATRRNLAKADALAQTLSAATGLAIQTAEVEVQ
ncbi:hypothetical protein HQ393_12365 [Chitinibacter bivalviorum]|uniref:PH domain-containing protein n=1 Tax=Chitinibacter bivalviorum TaxID=2739434 RepID=A0A7H9BKV7_9NEIS|nr:hypothetical protein [Chitinibacter bivalviorum]QLG88966.1 hypothetical protein HQ393_12365 [Chitinibacter bivalviorum]